MNVLNNPFRIAALIGSLFAGVVPVSQAAAAPAKPTIILVHGAFADSSSWDGVSARLEKAGYTVIGAANHLRSVKSDAASVASVVKSVPGSVILVGHSYGGSVISEAAEGAGNVKGLVYVAAFAPEAGETAAGLSGKFPGGTLGTALSKPVPLGNGSNDLYIEQAKFHDQFAADVPADKARLMAIGQRPITDTALNEASTAPAWKTIPSWFVYGAADKNIPPAVHDFMAKRAKAKDIVVVKGASHVVMVSHPDVVAKLIEDAARTVK